MLTDMQVAISNWNKMAAIEHSTSNNSQRLITIGYVSFLLAATALSASFRTTAEPLRAVDVGEISELSGYAKVIRDKDYEGSLNFDIQQLDDVRTSAGRVAITFLDESKVRLTEHSKLIIDEYIYDPNPSKSKMALKFASGTARFITSSLNRIDKQNISLKTPTADIAIRGTDFTCTVDELGRSLIILLPDANGDASGEIVVSTMMGSVTLNKPYEATTAQLSLQEPTKPVILDLSLEFIDNMLIVNPPREDERFVEESIDSSRGDYLDFNDLDIDFLNEEFLDDRDLEFTELDINYLDVNFLEDLLDILDDLAIAEEEDQLAQVATSIGITGTEIGQDTDTQITTIITGQTVSLRRSVGGIIRLDVDGSNAYTIIFIQNGISRVVKVNGGSDSTITITQSN